MKTGGKSSIQIFLLPSTAAGKQFPIWFPGKGVRSSIFLPCGEPQVHPARLPIQPQKLAPSNIQVNALACGVIDTEMNGHLTLEERAALEEEIPAGRYGTPQEAAAMILLLSESPSYLTGQIIGLDGGIL